MQNNMISGNDKFYIYLAIISVIGTFGNLVVACVYWKKRQTNVNSIYPHFILHRLDSMFYLNPNNHIHGKGGFRDR